MTSSAQQLYMRLLKLLNRVGLLRSLRTDRVRDMHFERIETMKSQAS